MPKPLPCQGPLGGGQQALEYGLAIPVVERLFTGGRHTAVQSRQEHILPTGQALGTFGNMPINGADEIKFFREIPQSGKRAKLHDLGPERFSTPFSKATQQALGCSQVHQHDRARFALHTP